MIQSLKQLTVRIDKLGIENYKVFEQMEKAEVFHNSFTFIENETGVSFIADNKEDLYELIENHYTSGE
jgi:hypothetical protein